MSLSDEVDDLDGKISQRMEGHLEGSATGRDIVTISLVITHQPLCGTSQGATTSEVGR